VITVTTAAEGVASAEGRARFLEIIRGFGFARPRLKVLSLFRIGAEETRTRAYEEWERLESLDEDDAALLQCSGCRMVTSQGVYVCPILIEEREARMGETLSETLRPFALKYGACHTCWVDGVTCST
jgi:hypothetical protein